jgi:hypothetical protein
MPRTLNPRKRPELLKSPPPFPHWKARKGIFASRQTVFAKGNMTMTTPLKPKRHRRTKAQMEHARLCAAANAEMEAGIPAIEAALARATPEAIHRAERTLAFWKRRAARH